MCLIPRIWIWVANGSRFEEESAEVDLVDNFPTEEMPAREGEHKAWGDTCIVT
jgi:hypothetical protein